MTTYNAKYFIDKFTRIPDELWCTDSYTIGEKHCAMGWCAAYYGQYDTEEATALVDLCRRFTLPSDPFICTSWINDGNFGCQFFGDTPKERILVALINIHEAGLG